MCAADTDAGVAEIATKGVFALTAEQLGSARVGSPEGPPPTYEEVKAALFALDESDEAIMTFMDANRDLLDYRFLYKLTSEKLRAGNLGQTQQAETLDAARKRAAKAAQRFDGPLFKQIGEAEGRLGGLLAGYLQGKPPKAKAIVGAAGETPLDVFAFWMVLLAAIAAWEQKLSIASVEGQAREKLGQLNELRVALEADAPTLEFGGVAPLHLLLAESDLLDVASGELRMGISESDDELRVSLHKAAATKLDELAPSPAERLAIVRRVGCLYCQAQRHGYQAYNPMVQRTAALYDVLYRGAPQPLDAVDIAQKERPLTSNLVRMAKDAENVMRENGVEIPLFW